MGRRKQLKLTERDKDFVKDLSRKLILRAYLANSSRRPRTMLGKLKSVFVKKYLRAPVVDILDAIEKHQRK